MADLPATDQKLSELAHDGAAGTPLPTVYQAIANAAKACKIAGLDARNEFDKYDYRSIRGVMDAAHDALAAAGVTVALVDMRNFERGSVKTSKGGDEVLITYTGVFRVYGPAGDFFETVHYCEGLDRRDKAGNKASTAGYKEVLQKLLTLPFGHDEVEQDGEDGGSIEPQKQRRPKGQQNAIDNEKPAPKLQPGTSRRKYKSERHVLIRDVAAKEWIEVKVDEIANEDLFAATAAAKERAEWHRGRGNADGMADADRDSRILRERIDEVQKQTPAGTTLTTELDELGNARRPVSGSKTSEAPDALTDAEGGGGDAAGNAAGAAAAAAQDGPAAAPDTPSGPLVCSYAVQLPATPTPEQIAELKPVTGLSADELALVRLLETSEVLAMMLHPANRELFDPAHAIEIGKFNDHDFAPLTGDWLGTAWHAFHNMVAKRARPMRTLLRLAIRECGLQQRAADLDAGKKPSIATAPATKDQVAAFFAYLIAGIPEKDVPKAKEMLARLVIAKQEAK
jgi:hypothetical protein